jgi:hypothetical protein
MYQDARRYGDGSRSISAAPIALLTFGLGRRVSLCFRSLRRQCAVIDPYVLTSLGRLRVRLMRPLLTPVHQQFVAVPVAHFQAEPGLVDRPHSEHHMRVRLGLGLPIATGMIVQREISDHSSRHELVAHEAAQQRDLSIRVQLARQGKLRFASELSVLSTFGSLDRVPRRRSTQDHSAAATGAMISLCWMSDLRV